MTHVCPVCLKRVPRIHQFSHAQFHTTLIPLEVFASEQLAILIRWTRRHVVAHMSSRQ